MPAVVVDREVLEALVSLRDWVKTLPDSVLECHDPVDFDFEWVDGVIENNDGSEFTYQSGADIVLLNDVREDEFGYRFKAGMKGVFDCLLNPSTCIIRMDSALDDTAGGMGYVDVMCSISDFTLSK